MNLNLTCPINKLSYGVVSRNILKELDELGHSITLFPLGQIELEKQEEVEIIQKAINNQSCFDNNALSLTIYHQFMLAQSVGRGPRVAMPIFELNRFSQREIHHLASQDRLLVCSQWAKEVVKNNLPGVHTEVVPLGVDQTIFYPADKFTISNNNQQQKPYIFLNVGKLEVRKSHHLLLDIFNTAFSQDDDVELYFMTHNPFLPIEESEQWNKLCKSSKLGDKIHILDKVDTQHQLAGIIRQCDCFISPSCAEGWNLPLLEAMSCNKPCITTGYSGHTEYCNKDNAYLIDIDTLEIAYDGKWFTSGIGEWAKLDTKQIDQCIEHMRYCYKNKINTNPAGLETAKKFTWKNSAETLLKHLTF